MCTDRNKDQGLPPVISLEAWAARQGGRITDSHVDGHIHAGLRSAPTTKTYRRWNELELRRLQTASDETKRLYEAAIARGEIRSPKSLSRRERLELTAAGHPDNPSVQAARRLLAQAQQHLGQSDVSFDTAPNAELNAVIAVSDTTAATVERDVECRPDP